MLTFSRAFALVLALLSYLSVASHAQDLSTLPDCTGTEPYSLINNAEEWYGESTTSMAFSATVRITEEQITFENGTTAKYRYFGNRQFNTGTAAKPGEQVCAAVYEFEQPFVSELNRGNTTCGKDAAGNVRPAHYMAAYKVFKLPYASTLKVDRIIVFFLSVGEKMIKCVDFAYARSQRP